MVFVIVILSAAVDAGRHIEKSAQLSLECQACPGVLPVAVSPQFNRIHYSFGTTIDRPPSQVPGQPTKSGRLLRRFGPPADVCCGSAARYARPCISAKYVVQSEVFWAAAAPGTGRGVYPILHLAGQFFSVVHQHAFSHRIRDHHHFSLFMSVKLALMSKLTKKRTNHCLKKIPAMLLKGI